MNKEANMKAGSQTEIMRQALATAVTLEDLDRLYVEFVGYSMVADDPTTTAESLRDLLAGYIDEVRASEGPAAPALQVGQQVKFAQPMTADEATERFVLIELRGPRVLVEFICDMALRPQSVYVAADLVPAGD